MSKQIKFTLGLVGVLALFLWWQPSSMAGGWAVVTIERLPVEATVDEPLTITFMVRQHGQHPVHWTDAVVEAVHAESGEALTFGVTPLAEEGRHTVEIVLPRSGLWRWQITPYEFPSSSGYLELNVLPADGGTRRSAQLETDGQMHGIQAFVALFLKFWHGNIHPIRPIVDKPVAEQNEATTDEWTLGKTLFVAKGCASCHTHNDVASGWSAQVGGDLSNYHRDGDFLRYWLLNSGTATSNLTWGMPTLELDEHEIEALIAFLLPQGS